jgi:hypothetical protein
MKPAWRRRAVPIVLAVVVTSFAALMTQQYVSAASELRAERATLTRAKHTLAVARDTREEQVALRHKALQRIRAARDDIAVAVQSRKDTEVRIADAKQQLQGTNELVEKAAVALFTVAGAGNDARTCLDGVTRATVALSKHDDQGALNALNAASDACSKTLVANDSTVACAHGSLSSATALQEFFNRRSELWAGADLTGVVRLPDGRKLWLFGDTLYAPVDNGTRGAIEQMGNNSAFVESGGCMRHVRSNGTSASWLTPPQGGSAYWPGGGVVVGSTLYVFLGRIIPEAPFGRLLDRAVATFSLPDLTLRAITPLPFGPGDPAWGASAVSPGDGFVYVYGPKRETCDGCYTSEVFLARAPSGAVADINQWTYFDGANWSSDGHAARSLFTGAGSHVSVVPFRNGWIAVSKVADILTSDIAAWWSPSPVGPWTWTGPIFTVPPPPGANTYSYMPNVVPGLSGGGTLVLSYNVGSLSDAEAAANAALYGPRFVAVNVPTVPGMS